MRVLLIEDDATTSAKIAVMLENEGIVCDVADLGEDGLQQARLYDYDIIILDLLLPDMDGYEVLRRLRATRVRTPVLILSGLDTLNDKVKGLGFGADDFLTKPFDHRELVARIQSIVRRSTGHPDSTICTGKLVVNLDRRIVTIEDQPLHLTGKEYAIFELLSLRKGTALTKEMILNHLYGGMDEPELKIIDVFICKLRKKLVQATNGENYIETVGPRLCAARPRRERRRIAPTLRGTGRLTAIRLRRWRAGTASDHNTCRVTETFLQIGVRTGSSSARRPQSRDQQRAPRRLGLAQTRTRVFLSRRPPFPRGRRHC
jgi:two-component system cell cycle response regulator CtrA